MTAMTWKPTQQMVAIAMAAGLALSAGQAQAHTHLVGATPAANAVVPAPNRITLHFSEKLEPAFSGLDLVRSDGSKVAAEAAVPPDDRKAIVAVIKTPLVAGIYRVMWRNVSADGHRIKGDFSFTVR